MKRNKKLRNGILLALVFVMMLSTAMMAEWGSDTPAWHGVYDADGVRVSESGKPVAKIEYYRGTATIAYSTRLPSRVEDAATEQVFADVRPGDWYYETVNILATNGIIQGDPDGNFRPNDYITEGEFATMLCRAMTNFDETIPAKYPWGKIKAPVSWADSAMMQQWEGDLYYTYPTKALNLCPRGTVVGTLFRYVSRRLPCQVFETLESKNLLDTLCNNAELEEYSANLVAAVPDEVLKDKDDMNYLDELEVGVAMAMGILKGDENGYLNLLKPITRAEVCQMFLNVGLWKANNYTAAISKTSWGH